MFRSIVQLNKMIYSITTDNFFLVLQAKGTKHYQTGNSKTMRYTWT